MGVTIRRGEGVMRREVVFCIVVCLIGSAMSLAVSGETAWNEEDTQNQLILGLLNDEEDVVIDDPEPGYLYFLNNGKRELPILGMFGFSIVVYETLNVYATANGADHVNFIARHMLTGVPGALAHYDLYDLCAAIAPRRLMIVNVLDQVGKRMRKQNIKEYFEFTKSTYQKRDAESDFTIHSLEPWQKKNRILSEWLN